MSNAPSKLQDILWFGLLYLVSAIVLGVVFVAFRSVDDEYIGSITAQPVAKALIGAGLTAAGALFLRSTSRWMRRMFVEPVSVIMPQLKELAESMRNELRELRADMRADREDTRGRLDRHEKRLDRLDDEVYILWRRKGETSDSSVADGPDAGDRRIRRVDLPPR